MKIGNRILAALLLLASLLLLIACRDGGGQKEEPVRYGVTFGEVAVDLDAPAAPILVSLGAWISYDESPTCAFEGMDRVYGYGSFELETYTLGGVEYIRAVHLLDDAYATREGIAIGVTRDAVVAVYGTADEESATALTYLGKGMRLVFLLRDGSVTNIQYLKNENGQAK